MRVLWISGCFPPQAGRLAHYNQAVTRHLAARVELLVVRAPGQSSEGARAWECPGLEGFTQATGWGPLAERLRAVVAEAQPDLIHLGHAHLAALRHLLPDLPSVCTIHGDDLVAPSLRYGPEPMAERIASGLASADLVCVSQHTADLVQAAGIQGRVHVLPNGCDLDVFRPLDYDRGELRHRLRIRPDVPLLMTVARLTRRKGHRNVMMALAGLQLPFHWLIVGRGPEAPWLKAGRLFLGMRGKLSMPGWLDQESLVQSYNEADLFVLTPTPADFREGVSTPAQACQEAAACGTPCIASDCSGYREAVVPDQTGLLVPPERPKLLRQAIRRLLLHPEQRRAFGDAALARVRTQGGWPAVAERLTAVYAGCRKAWESGRIPRPPR